MFVLYKSTSKYSWRIFSHFIFFCILKKLIQIPILASKVIQENLFRFFDTYLISIEDNINYGLPLIVYIGIVPSFFHQSLTKTIPILCKMMNL